jgi:hypothetical protein
MLSKTAKTLLGINFDDPDWDINNFGKQAGKQLFAYLDII